MTQILPVVVCGGSGTRIWPLSRESLPKQFLPLVGTQSTFKTLLSILASDEAFAPPVVISNHDYRFLVAEQMAEAGVEGEIVLETTQRDTAASVAVATELALRQAPETIVAVFAADHAIADAPAFAALCRRAAAAASTGALVRLAVKPAYPATEYGYMQPVGPVDAGLCKVGAFVERPDTATATRLIDEGYLWNSGDLFFRADVMAGEIAAHTPALAEAARVSLDLAKPDLQFLVLPREPFETASAESIDTAVVRKSAHAVMIAGDFGWADTGNWPSVHALSPRDEHGNSVRGDGIVLDASNVFIRSEEGLTAVIGVDNVVVVTTGDAVLVTNAEQAGKIRDLVEQMKRAGRREPLEHKRIYRPWGYYQSVDHGARHQVKRISVKPGGKLSLQKHFHRAEHWVVVKGVAEVTLDDKITLLQENESIYLPIGCVHRLANPGKIDLEIIEVQTGGYLGEDDIVRIEDIYNRN
ncbi:MULTISPECIES: mannose-1-phosphate guanylyltransferase/mannose-6-phosphate isomerase [unclassified Beijerinckia]|uniref:mannose-1-phosphate guanylyltransferase/mannose-6-phosphate isomerase n=1 Tax=unclassified Beijerinckia TaxID=2638183 RepID=UPI000B878C7B|nr:MULTISPECIES: mannose-1-phosphate guanylyltransferase/mannose-6-phosphate isomerase [unclassified Beijerinckia]